MSEEYCPICYTHMEVRDVAPCMNCGAVEHEIRHALNGAHTYSEWRIIRDLTLVLCEFCKVDIASYDPTYFGLPQGTQLGLGHMDFVRDVENVSIVKDKYCPECRMRLALLKFVEQARNRK